HLVEIGFRLRLDRQRERGLREGERREHERALLGRERIARLGDRELRDGPDLAGLELADGFLLLAVEEEQLADALVLSTGAVPGVALVVDGPGHDPQIGQPADERVGIRLEDADEERAGRVRRDTDRIARLWLARGRRRL